MKLNNKDALKELLKSTGSSAEFLEELCKEEVQTSDAFSGTPQTVVKDGETGKDSSKEESTENDVDKE